MEIKKPFSLDFSNSEFGITWIFFCPLYSITNTMPMFSNHMFFLFSPLAKYILNRECCLAVTTVLDCFAIHQFTPFTLLRVASGSFAIPFIAHLLHTEDNQVKLQKHIHQIFQLLNLLYINRS